MDKRTILSLLGILAFAAGIALAGGVDKRDGPPCPETQGGPEGTGEPMELEDPVFLPRGEFVTSNMDIMLPGRGLNVYLERTYRARSQVSVGAQYGPLSALGLNWSHNYEMWIEGVNLEQSSTYFKLYLGNERMVHFRTATGSSPVQYSTDDYPAVIEYETDQDPVLYITSDNTVYEFFAIDPALGTQAGMLSSITDRNGNKVTLVYESGKLRSRIANVSDGLGNTLQFLYYDNALAPDVGANFKSDLSDLLWRVIDHSGRIVEYKYEYSPIYGNDLEIRQLTEVVLPAHKNATGFDLPSEHERFLNGRSLKYEYYANGNNFTGLLTKVTDENGVDILENFYTDPLVDDYEDEWSRRIYKQDYAGEIYTHMLTSVDGSDVTPNTDTNDFAVWVQKRNGTVVKLVYADAGHRGIDERGYHLISRTDYPGVVPPQAKGKVVWHDETVGGLDGQWYYANTPDASETPFTSLVNQKRPNEIPVTKEFEFNDDWKITKFTQPNGDVVEYEYGSSSGDARSRQGLTKVTTKPDGSSDTEWITEEFEYDGFTFWTGVPGACGCGGSQQFFTAHIDGNGNRTEYEYSTAIDPPLQTPNGNVKAIYHDIPPAFVNDPDPRNYAAAVEEFTYSTGGNIASHLQPESTRLVNGAPESFNRLDEFEYYSSSHANIASRGKLKLQRVDADQPGYTGQKLETQFEYDIIGNVSKIIDPDGDVNTYLYNQGRQLVREQHWDSNESTLFAQTDYFYDAKGNVVIEKVANLDHNQAVVAANPVITTVYEYDDRDLMTKKSIERGVVQTESVPEDSSHRATAPTGANWVTQEWAYDENDNLIEFKDGDAVANSSTSFNITTFEYDFRELLYRQVDGAGSANELVTQYDYDKNKRLVTRTVNPQGLNGGLASSYGFEYDGFDRVKTINDAMLNTVSFTYDDNHNQLTVEVCGAIEGDTVGADTNRRLYHEVLEYDSRDRVKEKNVYVFDFLSSMPSACSSSLSGIPSQITSYTYNDDSSIRQVDEPSGAFPTLNTTEYFYDTVGRLAYVEDAADNAVELLYDSGSNLAQLKQYDVSTLLSSPQTFVMDFQYDVLDRRISQTDSAGNQTLWRYDSRSNLVHEIGPRLNLTTFDYDGLDRLISTAKRMTADGDGPENDPVLATNAEIVTTIEYDDSSRVIAETDDNGNTTTYSYDDANRRTAITMPDGLSYLTEYNGTGLPSRLTDPRNVVVDYTYDYNNRLTKREVNTSLGATPEGHLIEEFEYDGLGRVTQALTKASPSSPLTRVTRSYDSRGFVRREVQNIDGAGGFPSSMDREVDYEFDLADNTTRILYPSGRDIRRTYDLINRLTSIQDHKTVTPMDIVEKYEYIGRRVEEQINGNSTQTAYTYEGFEVFPADPSVKGFGRVVGITTTHTNTSAVLDDFEFDWDASQNRTSYNDLGSGMKNRRERSFSYDSSDRLIQTDVDFPDASTDYTSPTNSGVTDYDLDGVHNRYSVTGFEDSGSPIGVYRDDQEDLADHVENNQYTYSPREGGGTWVYEYDANGNMILKAEYNISDFTGDYQLNFQDYSAFLTAYGNEDESADLNNDGHWNFLDVSAFLAEYSADTDLDNNHYTYDFRNQLVQAEFKTGSTPSHTVTNSYDAFSRRVQESTSGAETMQLVYGGVSLWEIIERIQLEDGAIPEKLISSHVFGIGIDDEVSYRMEDLTIPEDFWTHRDDHNSLISLTDAQGAVVERYEYGDYGEPRVINPATGDVLPGGTQKASIHLYTGRVMISGTGLTDFRSRVIDSQTGRFVQRDPLGYIDSLNAYAYVVDNPHAYVDPYGLSYWRDFVDGWNSVVDTFDGTAHEEATEHANNITRMTNINYKKAKDRGDDCFAQKILKQGYADAAAIMENATNIAEQVEELIQQIVDEIITAPVPGPGGGAMATAGKVGRYKKLSSLVNDPNLGKNLTGWIKQEKNSIKRRKRKNIRNPPGKEMAHERGREAAKGYDYSHTNLQDRDLHRLQHKHDGYGRKNKERPIP